MRYVSPLIMVDLDNKEDALLKLKIIVKERVAEFFSLLGIEHFEEFEYTLRKILL